MLCIPLDYVICHDLRYFMYYYVFCALWCEFTYFGMNCWTSLAISESRTLYMGRSI